MKKIFAVALLLPAFLFAAVESTETQHKIKHEFVLGTTTGAVITQANTFSLLGSVSYHYSILPWLQFGGTGGFGYATGGIGFMGQLALGPTFNWIYDGNLKNAFFLSTSVGMDYCSGDCQKANLFARVDLGKRFEIFRGFVYRPTVGALFQKGASPAFIAMPVAFSVAF